MILYPAMDLMGGRVVRLSQGRFEEATTYASDPAEALDGFAAAGARWAHVVDLDGARAREPVQHDLRGFRTRDQVARMFDSGASRIVVGSLAVDRPDVVRAFLLEFGGERITLSLDVRLVDGAPIVATAGWTRDSGRTLWDVAALYPEARHLLLTDIGRDGMLAGPNFDLLEDASARLPHVAIQASGGVSSLDDLRRLGTGGAIVGKALWEGRIDLAEAVRACA
jgi:phosphoribosylformimino-5-aminoimidazole carboxamide ribotide isomerase